MVSTFCLAHPLATNWLLEYNAGGERIKRLVDRIQQSAEHRPLTRTISAQLLMVAPGVDETGKVCYNPSWVHQSICSDRGAGPDY